MGVDISVFIEKRDKDTGKWNVLGFDDIVYDGRDYGLFGILANVRNNSGALQPPRGLPDDVSDTLKKQYDTFDYFSSTYYDFCELELASYVLCVTGELLVQANLAHINNDDCVVSVCGVEMATSIDYNIRQFHSLSLFIEDVKKFIRSHDGCNTDDIVPNEYRIVMWFDS